MGPAAGWGFDRGAVDRLVVGDSSDPSGVAWWSHGATTSGGPGEGSHQNRRADLAAGWVVADEEEADAQLHLLDGDGCLVDPQQRFENLEQEVLVLRVAIADLLDVVAEDDHLGGRAHAVVAVADRFRRPLAAANGDECAGHDGAVHIASVCAVEPGYLSPVCCAFNDLGRKDFCHVEHGFLLAANAVVLSSNMTYSSLFVHLDKRPFFCYNTDVHRAKKACESNTNINKNICPLQHRN